MARIPLVITTQGEEMRELSEERRNKWISAISREDLTDSILEHGRVCGKHFISGQAAKLWERYDPDWVPTQNLGHKKINVILVKSFKILKLPRSETRGLEIVS